MSGPEWKELASWAWGLLLLPVGVVWKKADGAVQKDDFGKYAESVAKAIEKHAESDEKKFDQQRETMLAIFKKMDEMAEAQGDLKATAARVEATLTFIRPQK